MTMEHDGDDATAFRPSTDHRARDESRVRFTPGELIVSRYRIIAPLGRGGMGEVYRADDVRLGQQVALKFLPSSIEHDPATLERLYAEVRIGRQVSHPNVCRLYDIVEFAGSHFIAMEYIDGEDLGSLLRRIGKLPPDKAIEITREISAGLAAAHGMGVVHRDLKPANIMIDGHGHARVMDFGLAALETDDRARREFAGTPAYMAPEQLRGGEATQKSDLYGLGLIVYEMFTGKRRFEARTTGELMELHARSDSATISEQTREIPPEIQRVLARCLQEDPAARPASIHAVIAALPGGDPLQAALDAGETPSPEMVAAAGATGQLRPAVAIPLFLLSLLMIVVVMAAQTRYRTFARVKLPKRPEILADRAREIAASFGYTREPADSAYSMVNDGDWSSLRSDARAKWGQEATIRPVPLRLSYRESPREMTPSPGTRRIQSNDPPFIDPGMVRMLLDPEGRLVRFEAVPPQRMDPSSASEPDWNRLLVAAGFDPAAARPVAPEWTATVDTDAKKAWVATYPGQPNVPIRIEAAGYRGRPVWFVAVPPWRKAASEVAPPTPPIVRIARTASAAAAATVFILGAMFAIRNRRRGRADHRGALRLAAFVAAASFAGVLLYADHSRSIAGEWSRILSLAGGPVLIGAIVWVLYLAVEPYLRRRWPSTLIGWSRVLAGNFRDPMVGRDMLVGVVAGGIISLSIHGLLVIRNTLSSPAPDMLGDQARVAGFIISMAAQSSIRSIAGAVLMLILHLIFRSRALAIVGTALVWSLIVNTPGTDPAGEIVVRLIFGAVLVATYVRFGVLATAVAMFVQQILYSAPLTLDPSHWYFGQSLAVAALLVGLAGYGLYRTLGTQPLFAQAILDE